MTIRLPSVPSAWQTKDPTTREDLRRLRVYLELLGRQMDDLQAQIDAAGNGSGTITSITSVDTSVNITNPSGPVVDLSVPTGTTLTSTAPVNVTKAAAAVGVGTTAARHDHKHDITTAAASAATPGGSAAEGSATSLARSDHTHSLPAFGTAAGTFAQGNDSRFDSLSTLNEYWCLDSTITYGSLSDEFTSGSLPTIKEWSTWNTPTNGGAINSTTTPAASNYQASANARRSWLMVRPAPSGTGVDLAVLLNSFTYAAGGFQFRYRFTPSIINTGTTANGVSRIYIGKDSSGNLDLNANFNAGYTNNNPQTYKVSDVIGGGSTDRASYTFAAAAHVATYDHELILIGSGAAGTITVKAYMRGPTGTRFIGSGSINENVGGTLRTVWRVTSTDSDLTVCAMDYIREYPDLKITP